VTVSQVAFAPDVFTWPSDDPQLIGGRCADCGSVTFPNPASCARCGSVAVEAHPLARRGTLWTFTTQEFLPPQPYASGETNETFVPYGMGVIELGDEVRVESRLTTIDLDVLRIGMEMEFVVVRFRTDEDGTTVMTFAFAPLADSSQGEDV
jgi:uncharacterized OB-fold protein